MSGEAKVVTDRGKAAAGMPGRKECVICGVLRLVSGKTTLHTGEGEVIVSNSLLYKELQRVMCKTPFFPGTEMPLTKPAVAGILRAVCERRIHERHD